MCRRQVNTLNISRIMMNGLMNDNKWGHGKEETLLDIVLLSDRICQKTYINFKNSYLEFQEELEGVPHMESKLCVSTFQPHLDRSNRSWDEGVMSKTVDRGQAAKLGRNCLSCLTSFGRWFFNKRLPKFVKRCIKTLMKC